MKVVKYPITFFLNIPHPWRDFFVVYSNGLEVCGRSIYLGLFSGTQQVLAHGALCFTDHVHPVLTIEVPRVLFLGICPDFQYFSTGVMFPQFGFHLDRGAVAPTLVEP